MRRLCVSALVVIAAAAPTGAVSGSGWAAIVFGSRCEARSRASVSTGQAKPQGYAGFAFDAHGPASGTFYAHLSRTARPGSTAMATIAGQPFLLIARGDWAWSGGAAQDSAIISAARTGGTMRIESRDGAGRRFFDYYPLAGAATAIDAAAADCAGKNG